MNLTPGAATLQNTNPGIKETIGATTETQYEALTPKQLRTEFSKGEAVAAAVQGHLRASFNNTKLQQSSSTSNNNNAHASLRNNEVFKVVTSTSHGRQQQATPIVHWTASINGDLVVDTNFQKQQERKQLARQEFVQPRPNHSAAMHSHLIGGNIDVGLL